MCNSLAVDSIALQLTAVTQGAPSQVVVRLHGAEALVGVVGTGSVNTGSVLHTVVAVSRFAYTVLHCLPTLPRFRDCALFKVSCMQWGQNYGL